MTRGRITIEFIQGKEPVVTFLGSIEPTDLQLGIYVMRQAYHCDYLAHASKVEQDAAIANRQKVELEATAKRNADFELEIARKQKEHDIAKQKQKQDEANVKELMSREHEVNKGLEAKRQIANKESIEKIDKVLKSAI